MKEIYSCEEFAGIVGLKKTTIWSYIRSGKIKAKKRGRRYLITSHALNKFINGRTS